MRLLVESWKHASKRRRFWITWRLTLWTYSFFLASSTEWRKHECSLPLATATYPRTKHAMHKPRRRPTSHNSQAHGAPASSHWPKVLFVPDSSGPKLAAPLCQATGNRRARTPPSLVGKRPHQPAFAPEFRTQYGWLLRPLQPATPRTCRWCGADAAQQTRKEFRTETPPPPAGLHPATIRRPADCPVCGKHCSCCTSVVTHMVNAHGITCSQALWKVNFPGESEPPEIPPELPPST
ncbi:hypothetical protein ECC02_008390 [Trypanosoma cruzi]|uniref:C2H2-type domain-containing protein n=1 Tax=Trypanosoma cruzi TaxID=5693 RepID=A0A7J6XWT5_TRYCR|nr:hypothetical protein ECC02_008390 [Trypanosoma cruzi]